MDITSGMKASLGGRYASALFDLARDKQVVDTVDASLSRVKAALEQSSDLRAMIDSPAISRSGAVRAMQGIASELKLDPITANFLGVLARNGRLPQLDDALRVFDALLSAMKGEARATVTSARPLTDAQLSALAAKLSARAGRTVTLDASVDPELLGGVRIQLGSELIDASVQTKLNTLATRMAGTAQ